jgi:hypothetical protein
MIIIDMKKVQIRQGVFETNSSSTHSLCICTKEEFEKFKNGELLHDWGSLVERKDAEDGQSYAEFFDNDYLDTYKGSFTTPSGDEMVAFGEYGYDG